MDINPALQLSAALRCMADQCTAPWWLSIAPLRHQQTHAACKSLVFRVAKRDLARMFALTTTCTALLLFCQVTALLTGWGPRMRARVRK